MPSPPSVSSATQHQRWTAKATNQAMRPTALGIAQSVAVAQPRCVRSLDADGGLWPPGELHEHMRRFRRGSRHRSAIRRVRSLRALDARERQRDHLGHGRRRVVRIAEDGEVGERGLAGLARPQRVQKRLGARGAPRPSREHSPEAQVVRGAADDADPEAVARRGLGGELADAVPPVAGGPVRRAARVAAELVDEAGGRLKQHTSLQWNGVPADQRAEERSGVEQRSRGEGVQRTGPRSQSAPQGPAKSPAARSARLQNIGAPEPCVTF